MATSESIIENQVQQNLPPTNQGSLHESTFYDRSCAYLGEFVTFFGIDSRVVEDLDLLVEATQPWTRGDHVRPEHKVRVTEVEGGRLHELYKVMGIKDAQVLPSGHYNSILGLGGMQRGNIRRMAFLGESLENPNITTDQIILLGGERPVYPEAEDVLIAETVEQLRGLSHTDPVVKKMVEDGISPRHETDLLRLTAALQFGGLILKKETKQVIEFERDGLPVFVTHTDAVPRAKGAPRHTTEACMADYVKLFTPAQTATVGFIATQPHTERVARSARRALGQQGREDLVLVPGGPNALDGYSHEIFRGEIARLLYEDQQQVTAEG